MLVVLSREPLSALAKSPHYTYVSPVQFPSTAHAILVFGVADANSAIHSLQLSETDAAQQEAATNSSPRRGDVI
jgi:hypothetical protein